ncbi:hypothetical protein HRbin26_00489 [bacterium HR26]|nr:hypothetical protein HRbin26_00489 [bacterium HR26]
MLLRMRWRTSGGTDGFTANSASGSPGARARMVKMTMLMATSVGIAVSKRLMMYRVIEFRSYPRAYERFRAARVSCRFGDRRILTLHDHGCTGQTS